MTTKYTIGTVAVTNGSKIVVGTGTKWLSSLAAALDLFGVAGGAKYDIAKIIDDTHLHLQIDFNEATASAQSYSIERNFAHATIQEVAAHALPLGDYVETIVGIGAAVAETSNTAVDVCSLALSAGDWDVSGTINRDLAGVTATRYTGAISPTADTIPAQAGGSGVSADSVVTQNATFGTAVTGNYVTEVGPVRVQLDADATIHLVADDLFSVGTIGLFGTLRARRAGQ